MKRPMPRDLRHEHAAAPARTRWLGGWVIAAAFGGSWACATGVDVSNAELAELCSSTEQLIVCDGVPTGSGGAGPTGNAGSGNNPLGNAGSSGSFSGTGGTIGSAGSTGASGSTGVSGSTGTSGSAGTGGNQPQQPLAQGQCMPAGEDDVTILYTDRSNGSATFNQATMTLRVENDGPSFELTALTMRYWFTDDGLSDFTADIDYASQSGGQDIKNNVTVMFGEENGSNYAAIGFSNGGTVGPEGVEQVQIRIHTSGYQPLDQSNDFSYSANGNMIENRNITPYLNGVQVGGCVPIP